MKNIFQKFTPFILTIFLFFYCWNVYWGGKRYQGFFLSDANGYYAYLPAVFIYHDLSFSFIDPVREKYFATHDNFDLRKQQKSEAINKWYCGSAVAIAPFFLVGHSLSLITHSPPDGYSFWYAWALSLSALFYFFIGLFALKKILKRFFDDELLIAVLLVFTVFATNLFYYATSEPAMSHIYSFAFINLFVLTILSFVETPSSRKIIFGSALFALIVLIRPLNGFIVLIIPFLSRSSTELRTFVRALWKPSTLVLSASIFTAILFIQFYIYKMESGKYLVYSYGNESFDFLHPHLSEFLFSYKKGLFIYLPLIFVSLSGFIFLYRENRWRFYSLLLFYFALIYFLASWWNWWYGGSFGTRPLIEYLFIIPILLGYTFQSLSGVKKKIVITACTLCLVICQVQTYQYRYYFIHWDKMDKERYWNVFMRLDLIAKKENPNQDLVHE